MPLALDFGNTALKVGVFLDEETLPRSVSHFEYDREEDFSKFIQERNKNESIIISSVLKPNSLENMALEYFENAIELDLSLKLPFAVDYKTPNTLGKDRIAVCAGACSLTNKLPLLIIDAGTCITYDFINEQNTFVGGAISPGIEMKLKAMHHFTGKLPLTTFKPDNQLLEIGKSTMECMIQGAVAGTINEIKGFIATFSNNKTFDVIITGGSAQYLASKIENITFAAPKLVLVGLQQIRKLNA